MKKSSYPVLGTALAFLSASTVATLVLNGWLSPGVMANPASIGGESQPAMKGQIIAGQTVIYVDPKRGTDDGVAGDTSANPLRTITAALAKADAGTVIQLAPGRYSAGEVFPLQLKGGVILRGDEGRQGEGVLIVGSGRYVSRTWARQNVTILAEDSSQILGVTVTNAETRGTGVWIENGNPVISNSTFVSNNREGIFVSGRAEPVIENNQFAYNGGNGISVTREAKGLIRGNVFLDTGFGLAIGHDATPIIENNQIRQNRVGVVVTQQARPILRGNTIENNSEYGVVAIAQSQPEIASSNTFQNNDRTDTFIAREPQGVPPTPTVAMGEQKTVFTCEPYTNGFATVAQKGNASIPQPMIIWKSTEFDSPENRCLQVTQRLNQMVTEKGGKFDNMLFATGRVNDSKVVCLVKNVAESCQPNNMLFALSGSNASNPAEVLRRLIAFSVKGGGNPVQELGEEAVAPLQPVADNLAPELGLWFVNAVE